MTLTIEESPKNPGALREYFLNLIESEYPEKLIYCTAKIKTLFSQYRRFYLMNTLIAEETNDWIEVEGDELATCNVLMNRDLLRAPLEICLVAWLTIDAWRWEQSDYKAHPRYYPDGIPEDLFYGLVLQYPDSLLRAVTWYAGFSQESFTQDQEHRAQTYAVEMIHHYHWPELHPSEIQKELLRG
ncbi:hypothetical protein ACQ4M3_09425 [Leptolyngbya sp. AN03gr2]|uniref:hypothetical protein n=1 Tax=Leptolyngbya sp. AN03gr2 TaxID=3423364 RepID=UPI003D31D0B8